MGFLDLIGLKANKKDVKVGSSTQEGNVQPPQNDQFKAYIPNFLYKPPFGYPLNKNVLHLKALAKNPFIFSIIRTLKDEASTTKWEIKLKKEYASEMFDENQNPDATKTQIKKVSDWFYNPNGNDESMNDIFGQWIQDLCEVDAAVGVKVFNKKDEFSQLFARDGGSFLKNPDIYGYLGNRDEIVYAVREMNPNLKQPYDIKMYEASYGEKAAYYQYGWTGNALPVPFGRREIVYICANPRTDSIYGRSPLEVIEEVLLALVYGVSYNTDFYLNGNMPDGMVNLVGADSDIAKAFQDRMIGKFRKSDDILGNNRRLGHQYPVYGGPAASFIPFQLSSKDMEIIEQQKWFTKLVWSAFGVTPDEMGYSEDSNRAVAQNMSKVHKRKALRPLLKKIEYMVNNSIMPELDSSGKLEFAFEDYDVDEEIKQATLYKMEIDGGWKTAEMVAEEEGIDIAKLKQHKEEEQQKQMELIGQQQNNPANDQWQNLKAIPSNAIPLGKGDAPTGVSVITGPRGGKYYVPSAMQSGGGSSDKGGQLSKSLNLSLRSSILSAVSESLKMHPEAKDGKCTGSCAEISHSIALNLNDKNINATIIDVSPPTKDGGISSGGHKAVYLQDQDVIIDTQTWQYTKEKADDAEPIDKRKFIFSKEEYENEGFNASIPDTFIKGNQKYGNNKNDDVAKTRFDMDKTKIISNGGSDRAVYELPDGKILKVAKTQRGLMQNDSEGDWGVNFLPTLHEKGKDYVVVDKAERDDSRTNKFLKPLKNFNADDFDKKTPEIQDAFQKIDEEHGTSLSDVMNYDVLWNDFKAGRNWGWKDNKPLMVDAGTLNKRILDKDAVNYLKDEWEDILRIRRSGLPNKQTNDGKENAELKAEYLKMELDELIDEHKKLVKVLEEDKPDNVKKELEKQKKELESYIEKKKNPQVKSELETDDISDYFKRVRKHLLEQIEKED